MQKISEISVSAWLKMMLMAWAVLLPVSASAVATDFARADSLFEVSEECFQMGEYQRSVDISLCALPLVPKDSTDMLGDFYSQMCVCYVRLGDFENAIQYGELCLKMDEESGVPEYISSSLNNLAAIYISYDQYEVAEEYLKRAIDLERELIAEGQDRGMQLAIRLGLLGETYSKSYRYEEALYVTREALDIDMRENRPAKAAIRNSQIGAICLAMGDKQTAAAAFLAAEPVLESSGNKASLVINLLELGIIYTEEGKTAMAEKRLLRAEEMAEEMQQRPTLSRVYNALYTLYKPTNLSKSLEYLEKYMLLYRTMHNEMIETQLTEFEVRYDTQRKEYELEKHRAIVRRQNLIILAVVIGLLMILALAIVFLRNWRLQRTLAAEQRELNATKDKFFSIISHDLKNPAMAQQQNIHLLLQYADQLSAEDMKTQLQALAESADQEAALLLDLLDWARLQTGRMVYNPVTLNVGSLIGELQKQVAVLLKQKNITLRVFCPEELTMQTDRTMLLTAMRNLLQNAIKFSYPNSEIVVSAEGGKKMQLCITDHGTGMTPEELETLFLLNNPNRKKGTADEPTNGLGMLVSAEMVEKCGGRIEVQSEKGKGTTMALVF